MATRTHKSIVRSTSRLRKQAAHQRYTFHDGTIVPGASTIAKIGADSEGLIHWAWDLGLKGLDYRKARDNAADIGTIAHYMIECHLRNVDPDFSEYSPEDVANATPAFDKFRKWWEGEGFTVIATEEQLVSKEHRYGGTVDTVAIDRQGRKFICDYKTSKAFYPENAVQLVALEKLQNEHYENDPVKRRAVVRIGKQRPGDFDVWNIEFRMEDYWQAFLAKLALYFALKNIK